MKARLFLIMMLLALAGLCAACLIVVGEEIPPEWPGAPAEAVPQPEPQPEPLPQPEPEPEPEPAPQPPPPWDKAALTPSPYAEGKPDEGIAMTIASPELSGDNRQLTVELAFARPHVHSDRFELEAWLEGQWYSLPLAAGAQFLDAFTIVGQHNGILTDSFFCDLGAAYGPLPAGRYRLVKTCLPYDIVNYRLLPEPAEIVMAEFTLEEDVK